MSTPFRHPQQVMRNSQVDSVQLMKPPKAPERPLVPYMRFSRKMWPKVRAENPEAQLWDIGKLIGQLWRDATETERAVYQHEYEIEKIEYEKAIKNYQNSHAYREYLTAKNRAKANEKASRSRMDAGGVVIQPVDEEETTINELSTRRLAAVRYDRNHRLISDLFSPAVVTDTRTIVAQQRMEMLKKQGLSLAAHQSKLEDELQKLEDIHNEKKRTIEKNSEEFAERLKKVCEERPVMDEARFEETVSTWKEKLLTAYEDYKKKQDEINAKIAAERERMVQQTPVLARLIIEDEPADDTRRQHHQSPAEEAENKQPEQTEAAKIEEDKTEEKIESMEVEESGVAKEVEEQQQQQQQQQEEEEEKDATAENNVEKEEPVLDTVPQEAKEQANEGEEKKEELAEASEAKTENETEGGDVKAVEEATKDD